MKNRDSKPVRRLARFPRWGLGVLMMATLVGGQTVDGHAESKVYDLRGFTKVRASVAVDVELVQGEAFSVVAHTEDGDFSGLEIEVADNVLIATRPEEVWKHKTISVQRKDGQRVVEIDGERVPTYTVRVTMPRIEHLGASGNSRIMARGIKTEKLAIHASSSADINAQVTGGDVAVKADSSGDVTVAGTYGNLDVEATSSGDVTASGTCDKLDVEASSSGDVEANGLTCQHGNLRASSSADIEARISGGDVFVDVNSSGDVTVSGTCGKLDVEASSSGDVKANGLTCQRGDLRATSGADVVVRLTETVTAHASSGGAIVVRGGATPVKVKESSGGDVSIRD